VPVAGHVKTFPTGQMQKRLKSQRFSLTSRCETICKRLVSRRDNSRPGKAGS